MTRCGCDGGGGGTARESETGGDIRLGRLKRGGIRIGRVKWGAIRLGRVKLAVGKQLAWVQRH